MAIHLGPDREGVHVVVLDDLIAAAGTDLSALDIDLDMSGEVMHLACEDALIEPGAINAHTHIYSGLVPLGMPPPTPPPTNFLEILARVWWRLDRALDEDCLRAAARLYLVDALMAGTTTLIDHHESPSMIEGSLDILADAAMDVGVRVVLCYGATERNAGLHEASRGLDECRRFIERAGGHHQLRGMVGLHASFTVSDETIRSAGRLCRDLDVPLHVHVAEDRTDVEDAVGRGYVGPLQRLEALGALLPGSILAHGVWLEPDAVVSADEVGAWLVQNPRSNHHNGVGYPRHLHHSQRVALGTDGFPAVMADEEAALIAQGVAFGEGEAALMSRMIGGHGIAAERFGQSFGVLAPGAAADLIVRDEGGVRHALVAGRIVVRDGGHRTVSVEGIRAEAADQAARLWAMMDDRPGA